MSSRLSASTVTDSSTLFQKAKQEFLLTLSQEERTRFSTCSSAEALLEDVREFTKLSKWGKRGAKPLKKIEALCCNLKPYFQVIEIFCGSNPQYANIAWGAFRLVLQLASNFTSFFEKLCEFIRRITVVLPQYEDILSSLKPESNNVSARLLDSLTRFYGDLFDFFQAIARVFSKPNGKLKKTPIVIGELLWKPFDLHVQDIVDRMKFHQRVVRDELMFAKMGNLQNAFESEAKRYDQERNNDVIRREKFKEQIQDRLSTQGKELFCNSVLKWLDPPAFKDQLERAQDTRENHTGEWLFTEPKYTAWINASSGSLLWVHGNPGWGKTVLASSVVGEILGECDESQSGGIVCHYFFEQGINGKLSIKGTYQALVAQIFNQGHRFQQICDVFALAIDIADSTASEHELFDLLKICVPLLPKVFFVLDGIDECADDDRLLRNIQILTTTSTLKTIFFSRPNVPSLRRSIPTESMIRLRKLVLDKDISVFLRSAISELQDLCLIPDNIDLGLLRDKMVQRSDGMFLWARLMINYLKSPALTRAERIEEISKTTPEGLDQMYERIIDHIRSMDTPSHKLAGNVLMWLAYARSSLGSDELKEIIWGSKATSKKADEKDDIDHAIIVCCCGLVEKAPTKHFRYIHLTAQEFMTSGKAKWKDGREIVPKASLTNLQLAEFCLRYLSYGVPAQPLSGNIQCATAPEHLLTNFPFLEYASYYWPEHISEAIISCGPYGDENLEELISAIHKFFSLKICVMVWVEANFALKGRLPIEELQDLVSQWKTYSKKRNDSDIENSGKKLKEFCLDMQNLVREWGGALQQRPHEIWNDLTAFSKSKFFAQSSALSVQTLSSKNNHEIDALFTISRVSDWKSRLLIGKLGIRPCREFYDIWRRSTFKTCDHVYRPEISYDKLKAVSRGWTAQYDIFDITNETEALGSILWALEEREVLLILLQSLQWSPLRHWKLKLPLAISSDLSIVIILRSIFCIDTDWKDTGGSLRYTSTTVDMDFLPRFTSEWSNMRVPFQHTYSYEWHLSTNNFHLFLRDFGDPCSCQIRSTGSLVAFEIMKCGSTVQVNRVNQLLLSDDLLTDWYISSHQALPYVAFSFRRAIWVWKFDKDGNQQFKIKCRIDRPIDHNATEELLRHYPLISQNISGLGISACGQYITISFGQGENLTVIPMPTMCTSLVENRKEQFNKSTITTAKRKNWGALSSDVLHISKIPKTTDNRVQLLHVVNDDNGIVAAHTIKTTPSTTVNGIELKTTLVNADGSTLQSSTLPLVRLPRSLNLDYVDATVHKLDCHDQSLLIVLAESTRKTYESDEQSSSKLLPSVIRKDPRSLENQSKHIPGGKSNSDVLPRLMDVVNDTSLQSRHNTEDSI